MVEFHYIDLLFLFQMALFDHIKPLFANKPLIIVANKVDVVRLEELEEDKRAMFKPYEDEGIPIMEMSTLTEEGISNVKTHVRLTSNNCLPLSLNANLCYYWLMDVAHWVR